MAWQHITFRVVTGNPFGLDQNRYGRSYAMQASVDDDLTTEQLIQGLAAEQFINKLDAPYFAFRLVPIRRQPFHASERTFYDANNIDVSKDLTQEQWQDAQEHHRRISNSPLMPGRRLKEEYVALKLLNDY